MNRGDMDSDLIAKADERNCSEEVWPLSQAFTKQAKLEALHVQ